MQDASTQDSWQNGGELSYEQGRVFREQAARYIAQHRLSSLMVFLLESHRPLLNIGYQASIVAEPLLHLFPGIQWKTWRAALFENDACYAELMSLIEAYSKES